MIPRRNLVAAYAATVQHHAAVGNARGARDNLVAMILVEIAGRGTRLGDAPKKGAGDPGAR
jgi:hypothetical protein